MVSVCLPSDALFQHLPSYLGFSYLGRGVYLHGCSSKAPALLLTLDEVYLLTAAPPDLEHGIGPLGPLVPMQPLLLGPRVAPPSCRPWCTGSSCPRYVHWSQSPALSRPSEQHKSHAMEMKKREIYENKICTFDSQHILIIR